VGRRRSYGHPGACRRAVRCARAQGVGGGLYRACAREEVFTGGTLLARRRNGTPLGLVHGVPLWLVAPGRACYSSL
jgi:DMSO/TMAO reductase YedYZ molybdopterin-dependent catalytic subunit